MISPASTDALGDRRHDLVERAAPRSTRRPGPAPRAGRAGTRWSARPGIATRGAGQRIAPGRHDERPAAAAQRAARRQQRVVGEQRRQRGVGDLDDVARPGGRPLVQHVDVGVETARPAARPGSARPPARGRRTCRSGTARTPAPADPGRSRQHPRQFPCGRRASAASAAPNVPARRVRAARPRWRSPAAPRPARRVAIAASATPNPSIASAISAARRPVRAARSSVPVTVDTVSTGPRCAPGIPSGAATTSPLPKPSAARLRKPSGDSAPRSAATISVASTTSPTPARPAETAGDTGAHRQRVRRRRQGSARSPSRRRQQPDPPRRRGSSRPARAVPRTDRRCTCSLGARAPRRPRRARASTAVTISRPARARSRRHCRVGCSVNAHSPAGVLPGALLRDDDVGVGAADVEGEVLLVQDRRVHGVAAGRAGRDVDRPALVRDASGRRRC